MTEWLKKHKVWLMLAAAVISLYELYMYEQNASAAAAAAAANNAQDPTEDPLYQELAALAAMGPGAATTGDDASTGTTGLTSPTLSVPGATTTDTTEDTTPPAGATSTGGGTGTVGTTSTSGTGIQSPVTSPTGDPTATIAQNIANTPTSQGGTPLPGAAVATSNASAIGLTAATVGQDTASIQNAATGATEIVPTVGTEEAYEESLVNSPFELNAGLSSADASAFVQSGVTDLCAMYPGDPGCPGGPIDTSTAAVQTNPPATSSASSAGFSESAYASSLGLYGYSTDTESTAAPAATPIAPNPAPTVGTSRGIVVPVTAGPTGNRTPAV